MPRRLVEASVALDLSLLDEPVYASGALVLTLRRLAWGGLALLSAASGILLGLSTEPRLLGLGPLELGPGALLPIPAAALALYLALQPPRPVSLEAQLLEALRGAPRRPKPKERPEPEDYVVEADRSLGVAEIEIVGYAVDPASGAPMGDVRVVVANLGLEAAAEVDDRGRYVARLELPRGLYEIKVVGGGGLELRRLRVRVT